MAVRGRELAVKAPPLDRPRRIKSIFLNKMYYWHFSKTAFGSTESVGAAALLVSDEQLSEQLSTGLFSIGLLLITLN